MAPVRLRDGIEVALASGDTIVCDGRRPNGDVALVSHAHGDHLGAGNGDGVVASELTAAVAGVRRGGEPPRVTDHPAVELLNAGHVPGSRSGLIETGEGRVLYTGDVSMRDRFFLSGFEPVAADVLVVESTYGRPAYDFPAQADVEEAVVDFLETTVESPVIMFGYAFGRAQAAQLLAARAARPGHVYATAAVVAIDETVEAHLDVDLPAQRWRPEETKLGPGDVLVRPGSPRSPAARRLIQSTDAVTVGLSGWAVEESYRHRLGVDAAFPLSDHCDFEELVDLVERVDPAVVYAHHGFADEFATELTARGYEAYALRRDQTTLAQF